MRGLIFAAAAGGMAILGVGVFAGWFFERPTIVRVAVPADSDEERVIAAAGKIMARERQGLRFHVIQTDSAKSSAEALNSGRVDMAVVRSDIAMPPASGTAVILSRSPIVIVAPAGADFKHVDDLNAKRIAVVQPRAGAVANTRLVETILAQYDSVAASITPCSPEELRVGLQDKRFDAVIAVGVLGGALLTNVANIVAGAGGGGPPVFLGIPESKAISQGSTSFETIEVPRGAFGGAQPRPPDDIETLSVSTRLVARTDLSDPLVGQVTRLLFAKRPEIALVAPLAGRMEAPSTDKDAALPTHPGAAAFIDDEEKTFLDQYSDVIYIGAMVLSVLASGAAAVASRMNASKSAPVEELLESLLGALSIAREAGSPSELDRLEREADRVLIEALRSRLETGLDSHRAALLSLAMGQVRAAIADQRRALGEIAIAGRLAPPQSEPDAPRVTSF